VAAASAYSKGITRATLENPVQLKRAVAGEHVRIAWTLNEAAQLPIPAYAEWVQMRSLGLYLRVRGAAGGPLQKVPARSTSGAAGYPAGRYVADVTVPAGGIASIALDVEGLRSAQGDAPVRAEIPPASIPITNDPFEATSADVGGNTPWGALAGGLAVALILLLTAYRRMHPRWPVTESHASHR